MMIMASCLLVLEESTWEKNSKGFWLCFPSSVKLPSRDNRLFILLLRFMLESAWHMVDTNRCLKQLDEWNVFQSDKWLAHQTSIVSTLPHQKRIRKSFLWFSFSFIQVLRWNSQETLYREHLSFPHLAPYVKIFPGQVVWKGGDTDFHWQKTFCHNKAILVVIPFMHLNGLYNPPGTTVHFTAL